MFQSNNQFTDIDGKVIVMEL